MTLVSLDSVTNKVSPIMHNRLQYGILKIDFDN